MSKNINKLNPIMLKKVFDNKVIGQDIAKKQICMAIDGQIKKYEDPNYQKTKKNLFLIGKRGSGKSEIIKTLKENISLPVVILDAYSLLKSENMLEDITKEVFMESNLDLDLAKHAIVVIENLDTALTANPERYFVDKEGMEFINDLEALLNAEIEINLGKDESKEATDENNEDEIFSMEDMMFIVTAALPEIEIMVKRRIGSNKIGFLRGTNVSDLYSVIQTSDFIDLGLPTSFIGAFDSLIKFRNRSKKEVMDVIAKSDLITNYTEKLKEMGKDLIIKNEAIEELATYSMEQELGLWSLKNMIESKMTIVEFDSLINKDKEIVIKTFLDV